METRSTKQIVLLNRVRKGNELLWQTRQHAVECSSLEESEALMVSIDRAWPRLASLCLELEVSGFENCLYGEPRCRGAACSPGWFCYVCPSVWPPVSSKLALESKVESFETTPEPVLVKSGESKVLAALRGSSNFSHLADKYESMLNSEPAKVKTEPVEVFGGSVSHVEAPPAVELSITASQVETEVEEAWRSIVRAPVLEEVKS